MRAKRETAKTFKRCSCGVNYDKESFKTLPLVGYGNGLELRNCSCKSTIGVRVKHYPG